MRDLFVVAVSTDGTHLVLASTPDAVKGSHRIPVDARLEAALKGDLGRPGQPDSRPESALTPREIQAMLRTGATAEEVARAAGVSLARIERFAGPVLSERQAVLDEAWAVYLDRSRRGRSALPLREAVDRNLAGLVSLRPETVEWTARKLGAGSWIVEVSYQLRSGVKTSQWRWQSGDRVLDPVDAAAGALGHAEDAQPVRDEQILARSARSASSPTLPGGSRPAPESGRTAAVASGKAGAKKSAATTASTTKNPAAMAAAGKATSPTPARPAAAKVAPVTKAGAAKKAVTTPAAKKAADPKATVAKKVGAAKKAAAPKAVTRKVPAPKAAPAKAARTVTPIRPAPTANGVAAVTARTVATAARPPRTRRPLRETLPAAASTPAPAPTPVAEQAPTLVVDLTSGGARATTRTESGNRTPVPSWSEVLLSTRNSGRTQGDVLGRRSPPAADQRDGDPEVP